MIHRRQLLRATAVLAAAPALARPALAQGAPLKIGMITTLSGPGAYLGQDIRDGFLLAMQMEGGKLGGAAVRLLVEDDELKPAQGKQIAERFTDTEKVRLLTGIAFSNVLGATVPDVLEDGNIYVGTNGSPSFLAGKDCDRNYWSVAWQFEGPHEAAGQAANTLGFRRVFLLAPNYQNGKDALGGFKRMFRGQIAGEVYTRLDQTDYAAELAQIRAAAPDAVYQFHPGALGRAFLAQYLGAGMLARLPMVLPAPSMDATTLAAVGEAAVGLHVAACWNGDFTNAANRTFVTAFMNKYNRVPTLYAQQGYDAALAIAAALRGTGGKLDSTDAFRAAMQPARFESTRGKFSFGSNQHPVQDWFLLKAGLDSQKQPILVTQPGKLLENQGDAYSVQCRL
ncbi:ABC transporter substrate-binding protein [Roseomonas haemaphysalidis]|uniref:ABC transporter substrate-binding protein n=1 Tax=Roseomonas haemaphysalidis TaxID=2768162 RepID=A0ABS3KSW0_9PROT|nr:ABC transporter substrate-binding protein [Roseomonas haemaphysalidis]MBO1080557.1 ABC transporter substrate-binding protein [Roseomonas haemaphysalidis]